MAGREKELHLGAAEGGGSEVKAGGDRTKAAKDKGEEE